MNWRFTNIENPKKEGKYMCLFKSRNVLTGNFKNGEWDFKEIIAWTEMPEIPTEQQIKGSEVYGHIASGLPYFDNAINQDIYLFEGYIMCKDINMAKSMIVLFKNLGLKTNYSEIVHSTNTNYPRNVRRYRIDICPI